MTSILVGSRTRGASDPDRSLPGQALYRALHTTAEDPARLLRVWSLLQATLEQLEKVTLPPEEMPGLQRQLQVVRRELERAVSAPLAAELGGILPPCDAAPSTGMLRIECAALANWAASLVARMLVVSAAARERSQQISVAVTDADATAADRSRV